MGAFGSTLGALMAAGSLFLSALVVWTLTDNMFSLLWFLFFGILGGFALGGLNSRKARTQAKYKNEYTSYAGLFIAFIVFLGIYFAFFDLDSIEDKIATDQEYTGMQVLILAVLSGLLAWAGVGLTVANSIAEN